MTRILAAALLCGSLAACSAAQINAAATQIQSACADAAPLLPIAGPLAPYIGAACTVDGIAKLASDPSSAQWIGQLIGQVKAQTGK